MSRIRNLHLTKTCIECNVEFKHYDNRAKFCSRGCSDKNRTIRVRHTNCAHCNGQLKNTANQFCSKSCAGKHNNVGRISTPEANQKRSNSVKQYHASKSAKTTLEARICCKCNREIHGSTRRKLCTSCRKPRTPNGTKPPTRTCKNCDNVVLKRKQYCGKCKTNISHYRSLCEFTFNVYDYPDRFDVDLVSRLGWYSPNGYKKRNQTPNLLGVSRDHLYSVSDGYKNNVDPSILAHPANCQLLPHSSNSSKGKQSSITIDELKDRIRNW